MRLLRVLVMASFLLPACARGGNGRADLDAGAPMDAGVFRDARVMVIRDAGRPTPTGTDAGRDAGRIDAGCTPSCVGLECGPDGCGGTCGTCATGACVGGACTCTPDCVGRTCGDDGCGGTCGTCTTGTCVGGTCSCTPNCTGRTCGDDGCGGSCGTCGSLCTDSCTYAYDFECDDGGPFSDWSLCPLGSDCFDCGPRSTFCSGGTCVSP